MLSSGDEEQKKSYEKQIELKKSRKEIPDFVKFVYSVTSPIFVVRNHAPLPQVSGDL